MIVIARKPRPERRKKLAPEIKRVVKTYSLKRLGMLNLCIFMLGTSFCDPAAAAQMNLWDLYNLCISSEISNKSACTFYILGVFEGASIGGGTVQDKSGAFQEAKDKRFCVPEGLTSAAMELTVKKFMGSDLAVFPQDRDMPAVSFVTAVIAKQFPCQKAK